MDVPDGCWKDIPTDFLLRLTCNTVDEQLYGTRGRARPLLGIRRATPTYGKEVGRLSGPAEARFVCVLGKRGTPGPGVVPTHGMLDLDNLGTAEWAA